MVRYGLIAYGVGRYVIWHISHVSLGNRVTKKIGRVVVKKIKINCPSDCQQRFGRLTEQGVFPVKKLLRLTLGF